MEIDKKREMDLSVLFPQDKYLSWIPYEMMDTLYKKYGWTNPYRNPDKTLDSLIYEEIRSN